MHYVNMILLADPARPASKVHLEMVPRQEAASLTSLG